MRECIPHPSCDDIDNALALDEDIVVYCDVKVYVGGILCTIMATVHQRLRNHSYLVEGDDCVAYIVNFRSMSNLKYDY